MESIKYIYIYVERQREKDTDRQRDRDHDFNNHGKIIIIEQLRNICTTSTKTLKEILKW